MYCNMLRIHGPEARFVKPHLDLNIKTVKKLLKFFFYSAQSKPYKFIL